METEGHPTYTDFFLNNTQLLTSSEKEDGQRIHLERLHRQEMRLGKLKEMHTKTCLTLKGIP